MKVLVSGASGLVGSSAVRHLCRGGHEPRALSRGGGEGIGWDPETGAVNARELAKWGGPDAVVHLAGENIASHRWSAEQKRRIRDSRVAATEKLARALLELPKRPDVFVCASAVGIYGNRGDEVLTEESAPGGDFLSEAGTAWEAACAPLRAAGVRVSNLRFGMVLSPKGGALGKMLPLFKMGLGGRLGDGTQWVSWIALEDAVRAIDFCVEHPVQGAFNAVAPNPVTNAEFTRELAKALGRPAIFPAPAFGLRAAFGEMADALLLSSQRALPKRLTEAGFQFTYPTLAEAFAAILAR